MLMIGCCDVVVGGTCWYVYHSGTDADHVTAMVLKVLVLLVTLVVA